MLKKAAAVALLALSASGCGSADDVRATQPADPSEEIGTAQSTLLGYPNVPLWTGGRVPACFDNAPVTEKQWVKDALKDAWEAVARIDFVYSDACPPPGESIYVSIHFTQLDGWGIGGFAGPLGMTSGAATTIGYCTTTDCLTTHLVDYEEAFKSVAVHEIGHILGFAHEQQRVDATPSCPLDPNNGNNTVIPDGVLLTPYYDPDSIMNYCRRWDGSVPVSYQEGYHAAERLSPGDALGAQTWYDPRVAYWHYASHLPLL